MIDLSIVIVNWNTRDLLIQCLESIFDTVREKDPEVFVVDNGSIDGSVAAIKEKFPGVKVIENQANLGFAEASNQALRLSQGKYVLLLNPDTKVQEEAIAALISFMETHPGAGVSGAQLLNSDGSKQNSVANFPSLATELLNKSLLRWLFPDAYPGKERTYSEAIEVDSVIGACLMVRRDALNQVGLLDKDYFLFLEETDWCYRMKRAGWKIFHVPKAQIFHLQGKSAEKHKKRAKVEYYRSRYRFFKKNKGGAQFLILSIGLAIKLVVELVSTGVGCLVTLFAVKKWRQRFSVYAYLIWWHLRLFPEEMGLRSSTKFGG